MSTKFDINSYLLGLLATIRTANGYQTEGGKNVFLDQAYTENIDQLPMVALFPGMLSSGPGEFAGTPVGKNGHSYEIRIEGEIEDTRDGLAGDQLRADIVKAITGNRSFSGLVQPVNSLRSQSTVAEVGKEIVSMVLVEFTCNYITAQGDE